MGSALWNTKKIFLKSVFGLNKMMEFYKRILCFIHNMHVAWKFTLAYFIIIALPIIVTGIYIIDSTTQTIIHQSGLLAKQNLLQKRESINLKIESIRRTSSSIVYNSQILKYLEDPYENNLQGYENYIYSFAPLYDSYAAQNKNIYDTMLYVSNMSFPNNWNGIYHLDTIEKDEWYRDMLEDTALLEKWRTIHDSKTDLYSGIAVKEKVFSLCRKLISFKDKSCLGLLEIEIPEKTLFENLGKEEDAFEYYLVVDDYGNIVPGNTYKDLPENLKSDVVPILAREDLNGVFTFKKEQLAVYSIPLDGIGGCLVSITPLKNYMKDNPNYRAIITGVIIIALILFGGIIHFVTNRLTKRLKILVKGLKSVRDENINIKMPVKNHDEFGELAESFNHMTDRIHDLIERVYKAQIMEKESELKALEAQINPHFLYNALSTISWMARKVNAENIDNLSLQLSKFYRLVLSKGNSFITVEDEINLLKAYVEIEMIRVYCFLQAAMLPYLATSHGKEKKSSS